MIRGASNHIVIGESNSGDPKCEHIFNKVKGVPLIWVCRCGKTVKSN
jgi:hypothetical protein